MSKKTTETKPEKQTEKKQPAELKDKQLDEMQGGQRQSGGPSGIFDWYGLDVVKRKASST